MRRQLSSADSDRRGSPHYYVAFTSLKAQPLRRKTRDRHITALTTEDLETGGPIATRHPIIQIAAVAVDGETLTQVDTFEIEIRFDERRATNYALRKNSYSRRLWNEQAEPEDAVGFQGAC